MASNIVHTTFYVGWLAAGLFSAVTNGPAFVLVALNSAIPSKLVVQALADVVDREQSGAAAAAESSRRDMEMKAKEESDLVHECQVCRQACTSSASVLIIHG